MAKASTLIMPRLGQYKAVLDDVAGVSANVGPFLKVLLVFLCFGEVVKKRAEYLEASVFTEMRLS